MNKVLVFKQETGCRPCDTLAMVLEQDLEVKADLTIDVQNGVVYNAEGDKTNDDAFELAGKYGVMATPVALLVDGEGKVLKDVRGLPQRNVLIDMFEQRG